MTTARLLPNTGVQYLYLPRLFSVEQLEQAEQKQFLVRDAVHPDIKTPDEPTTHVYDDRASPFEEAGKPKKASERNGPKVIAADPKEVSGFWQADGGWLPIPFGAPTPLWAQLYLRVANYADVDYYDGYLAIDTTTTSDGTGGTLPEHCVPGKYSIEPIEVPGFWGHASVVNYIERHFRRRALESNRPLHGHDVSESRGALQGHLAAFYLFVASLPNFPEVEFEAASREPVAVNLIVDLGNSRTCCVLQETQSGLEGRPLFYRLRLRDPRAPDRTVDDPFETRLAFVPRARGVLHEAATFGDLSICRVGKLAADLLGATNADFGSFGMSSPKRYLWEVEQTLEPWRVCPGLQEVGPQTIHGPLLRRIHPQKLVDDPEFDEDAPADPRHPRSFGVLALAVELLEQAYRQLNGMEHRGVTMEEVGCTRRRVISNVVFMHPGGMHSQEVTMLGLLLDRAARIWSEYRNDPIGYSKGQYANVEGVELEPRGNPRMPAVPKPRVIKITDEGLAIQICYLYGLAMHRFHGEAGRLMRTLASDRQGRLTLRLASLDIGGGTTDFAIADYTLKEGALDPVFEPRSLFRDGYPAGGDDVIQLLLEQQVFPQVRAQMGVSAPDWNELFSATRGSASGWPVARRSLVSALWLPLAHACLAQLERGHPIDAPIEDLLKERSEGKIRRLNEAIAGVAVAGSGREHETSIVKVRLAIDPDEVFRLARRTLGRALQQYSDLAAQARCDLLVIGGRTSALPAVRELLQRCLPVHPGCMVFLHEEALGDWYPFADRGLVGDSKTCGVMGAAIAFLASRRGSRFVLRWSGDEPITAVQGVMNLDRGTLREGFELFTGKNLISNDIPFHGNEVFLGTQRVVGPTSLAKPCYRLSLDPFIFRHMAGNADDVLVSVRRESPTSDVIRGVERVRGALVIESRGQTKTIRDDHRAVRCRLQTLVSNEHWLDTGRFREQTEGE